MTALTNAERETHLNMTADNRGVWKIASDDPVMLRRLEAVGATLVRRRGETRWYTLPAEQVTIRRRRELSSEQRAVLSERAKAMRKGSEVQP